MFSRARYLVRRYKNILTKAVIYAAIGFVNVAIDLGVFLAAVQILGIPKIAANILSWTIAVSASYAMNTTITFAAESGRKLRWKSYFTFAGSGVVGLVANTTVLLVGNWILTSVMDNEFWRLVLAKMAASGASFIVNFSMSHFIVFRRSSVDLQS